MTYKKKNRRLRKQRTLSKTKQSEILHMRKNLENDKKCDELRGIRHGRTKEGHSFARRRQEVRRNFVDAVKYRAFQRKMRRRKREKCATRFPACGKRNIVNAQRQLFLGCFLSFFFFSTDQLWIVSKRKQKRAEANASRQVHFASIV